MMTTPPVAQLRLGAEKAVQVGVDEKVPVAYAALLGLQHVLAMFMGVITPPLLLAQMLSFPKETTARLVSTALLVAAATSFIQIKRPGRIGSGLLSAQGTSFTFLNPLHQVGQVGGLPLMLGMSLVTAPVSILLGPFLPRLSRIFTPVVSGTVIMLIGISLIPAGMHDVAMGFGPGSVPWHSLAVAAMIILIVVALGSFHRPWARMLAVLIALVAGYAVSAALGYLQRPPSGPWIMWPRLFSYGLAFQWQYLLPFAFLYIVSSIETVGDVTATCQLSGLSTQGDSYWSRIRGGVMADGVNSMLAACLGIFPNTTYAQNNGVIQLTGVASRQVGCYMCGFLLLFGLLPVFGRYLAIMPPPVLGGLSLVLFGFVATGGIRILYYSRLTPREWMILAVGLGVGIGVGSAPEVLDVLPVSIAQMFHSSVVTGGLVALVLNAVLPHVIVEDQTA
jgi:uracil-xanthine permease